ncbi:MAG TPA: IPT/TIG domain-containing protein, partial [Candidatus Obscuribacterales bacterium]
ATVTNATATSLTVTVPSGIGNSKNVTVTVGGQTSTDTTPFEVIPVITSLNSTTGIVGSFVTITGTGFDNSAVGNNIVKFGNTTGTVQSVTGSTSMSVQVAGIAGPQTVRLTIGNQINAETNFSYTIKTTLLSMTAASGACSPNCNGIITSTLTLTGAGFDYETPSNNIVTFNHTSAPTNTTQATVSAATATTLTVTVPEGIYGSQNVLVTVNSQTNTGTHIFGVKPLISQLSPTSGNTSDTILMTGTGFDPNAPANNFVKFVGLGASITVTNPTTTSLNFSVPNVVAGNYNVTVQVGTVTSASSPFTHN